MASTLLRSCSSTAGSMAFTSTCPPRRTRWGYRSAYDAKMISRGFLSVSWSLDETYSVVRATSWECERKD
jgi:hypothetical protein